MATATTTASSELEELQRARDKAHAKVREVKAKMDAWAEETRNLPWAVTARRHSHPSEFEIVGRQPIPRPGTEAEALSKRSKARMGAENPHRAAYDEAFAPYEQADRALEQFKQERVRDRLEELHPDHENAVATIREGLELLRQGCQEYRVVVDRAMAIVVDTPRLNGQHLGHDPRPGEWLKLANAALDDEIAKPGLNYHGELRLG